jgi:hypothetical protein
MDIFVRTIHEAWWTINCAISEPKISIEHGDYGYDSDREYQ